MRNLILLSLSAAFITVTLSSYHSGLKSTIYGLPDSVSCGGNPSCHHVAAPGTLNFNAVLFENPPINTIIKTTGDFKPGYTYGVEITGTINSVGNNDTAFGFQFATIGWNSAMSYMPAGHFDTAGSAGRLDTFSKPNTYIIEQNNTLHTHWVASNPYSFKAKFTWTAPDSTSPIDTIWINALLCAVDGDGTQNNDAWGQSSTGPMVLIRKGLSVNTLAVLANIHIYPNPSHGLYYIDKTTPNKIKLEVYNMQGKLITRLESAYKQLQIDIRDQPNGIYFACIRSGENTITKKLVKD